MAKKKDNTIKESTVAQEKKKATRKKKDGNTVSTEKSTEKVKASPIKKTINTEKPKTVKEIVNTTTVVEEKKEQPNTEQQVVVPTHIGGVKLSDRLINLLRRQASNK